MRLHLLAVGRLGDCPEQELVDHFLTRFDRIGRSIKLGPTRVHEVVDRRGRGRDEEVRLLRASIPKNATVCALDHRGKVMCSKAFAKSIGDWRDKGTTDFALLIGGADGLGRLICNEAQDCISFGSMVWPHRLMRVMLAEQLYRAATILAGSPYHRS
ncbi:MAG: 23S rRNA (pseudouridine(1915)-N(3))-methyltransferase RlmH [Aestuariivita sp.]|nr:23S rRNA (pseudouridine(1915)-N(3))-methyltransferase RlmH [Aestuariivita sp.]MCY4201428.1 23S rRNA (pseudouridine(1915)-N(3))-methyltransferase RlmH [Aestuariivita sp.]MCY4287956.1 23S rRNA (pseudouridine(1915)-N(3))-methyltransferase RlmH [Aestuariivita sp.]MCY4346868.1 23S rRNA (pseudouridine(1915)-N(3))-methyltransferase RlmH [Aestuariivita sp.]